MSRRSVLRGAVAGGTSAALYSLTGTSALGVGKSNTHTGRTREYWIQAEAFQRSLAPSNHDDFLGRVFVPEDTAFQALCYRAYTPGWREPLHIDPTVGGEIPGPVIRGEVGDTIVIHFRNNDTHYRFPHSIHVHGLVYEPGSDGAWIASRPDAPGTAVLPGHTYSYRYKVAPTSVGTWVYHDHSMPQALGGDIPVMDISAQLGMFGLIAIDPPGAHRVDREYILYLHQLYASDVPSLAQDFACLNGTAFLPNTPVFHAKVGERVRWRIGALGQEFYVFHLHGHRWTSNGEYRDTEILGPSTTATVEYVEDAPGRWFYHANSTNHLVSGMIGEYVVNDSSEDTLFEPLHHLRRFG